MSSRMWLREFRQRYIRCLGLLTGRAGNLLLVNQYMSESLPFIFFDDYVFENSFSISEDISFRSQ